MNDSSNAGLTRREFVTAGVLAGAASLPTLSFAEVIGTSTPPTAIDLLILGPDIVTFDDHDTVIPDGAIAVKGNAIVWIGKSSDAAQFKAASTLNAAGQIAMPGVTDAHYHTAQQFLRGLHRTTHRQGPTWKKTLIPFESGLEPDDIYDSGPGRLHLDDQLRHDLLPRGGRSAPGRNGARSRAGRHPRPDFAQHLRHGRPRRARCRRRIS